MRETTTTLLRGTVVDGHGRTVGAGLELGPSGRVVRILPAGPDHQDGGEGWITPGLIDIHCHGGGGASFPDAVDPVGVQRAVDAHRRLGTTGLVASLVSMHDPVPAIELLVDFCRREELLGIHLEGPYVSPHKAGAQNPAAIREPDDDELTAWLAAGEGFIRTMTLAPEVPGAIETARTLLDHGARPSWGHTVADGPTTRAALEATAAYGRSLGYTGPAQTATHLFNAMPAVGHRDPGPVVEFLRSARRGECVVELIGDGVHLHSALVGEVVASLRGSEAVALVSDAMEGAGMPDGSYTLGSLPVTIAGGVARLTEGGAIAGGTARIAQEIATLVRSGEVSMGDAICAAVADPARALGLDAATPGVTLTFSPGTVPDLVVWNRDLGVERVLRDGRKFDVGD